MKYRFLLFLIGICLLLSACSPTASPLSDMLPFMVTITPTLGPLASPALLASPLPSETPLPEESSTPEMSASPAFTPTSVLGASPTLTLTIYPTGTMTATAPTPTETLLPLIDIPTEKPSAPAFIAWTGEPTYPGDSEPGRLFRVDYDPDIWAQTTDNFGQVVLAHRQIDYCTITAWSGRGLPADTKVEHEFRNVGNVPYDVNTVTMGDTVKFVAYVGGDQRLLTGFQVAFQDQQEQCLKDAETILATLRSFAAEPTITPTFTPNP